MDDNLTIDPHSLDAERSCLGCCLLDHKARVVILSRLKRHDFYQPSNGILFNAIADIASNGGSPNFVSVGSYLMEHDLFEAAGGADFSAGLSDVVPTVQNAEAYASIVKEASQKRALIRIGNQITKSAGQKNGKPVKALTSDLYDAMLEVLTADQATGAISLSEAITRTQATQNEYKQYDYYSRMKTGFYEIDQILTLLPGKVLVVGAKTSCGKSAFALCVCNNLIKMAVPVLYISIEMDYSDVVYRLGAMNGDTSLSGFVRGNIADLRNEPGLKSLSQHMDDFHMCDLDSASEVEIVLLMQQHMMRYPRTGLIVIDYLQNVDCERFERSSRHLQIASIARYFRSAAKRLKVPVMVLSQLSRGDNSKGEKFRMASVHDLKESGDIETGADAILLINRLEWDTPNWPAIFDICKQRQGPRGKVEMKFTGASCSFDVAQIPSDILAELKLKRTGRGL